MCFDNWVGWGEEKRFLGMRMRFRGRNKDGRNRQREPQEEKKKILKERIPSGELYLQLVSSEHSERCLEQPEGDVRARASTRVPSQTSRAPFAKPQ